MIIVSQNKRCIVEPHSISLMADIRPVADSYIHMGYDIWVNETIHVAKYTSEAQAQQVFDDLWRKWAEGEAKWYWMPEDNQS